MRMDKLAGAGVLALVIALSGCAAGGGGAAPTDDAGGATPSQSAMDDSGSGSGSGSGETVLETEDSSLGEIVVDGAGMTVYMFDNDTQGTDTSACTGQCLENWPIVTVDSADVAVEGVTGDLATIDTPDGKMQLTLNGWPLYYFAGDAAKGDVNGQGVGGIWWVLTPAGEKIGG